MRAPSIFGLGIIYYDHKIFWKTSISYRVGVKVGGVGGKKCYFFGNFCVVIKWMTFY